MAPSCCNQSPWPGIESGTAATTLESGQPAWRGRRTQEDGVEDDVP